MSAPSNDHKPQEFLTPIRFCHAQQRSWSRHHYVFFEKRRRRNFRENRFAWPWWLEKNPKNIPQMMVKDGDFTIGTIRKKTSNKQIQALDKTWVSSPLVSLPFFNLKMSGSNDISRLVLCLLGGHMYFQDPKVSFPACGNDSTSKNHIIPLILYTLGVAPSQ